LIGCGLVVSRGFVPVMLSGVLVGITCDVAGHHRGLFVRGRSHPVNPPRLGVPFGGRMVSASRALQSFFGALARALDGLCGRWGSLRQLDTALAQFAGAGAGEFCTPDG
jgi:hypothetical protein